MNFNFTLKEGEVYLCYKDNDTLNILTNEKLLISSFENNNRVFYLVSDDLNNFLYTVKANIKGFNKEGYDVSIDCNTISNNFDNGNISSFIINTDNPSFYEEAIPINIRIKSKNSNDINSMLVLNIDRKPLKINVDEGPVIPEPEPAKAAVLFYDNTVNTVSIYYDTAMDSEMSVLSVEWGDGSPEELLGPSHSSWLDHNFVGPYAGRIRITPLDGRKDSIITVRGRNIKSLESFGDVSIKFHVTGIETVPSVLPTHVRAIQFNECPDFNDPSVVNWQIEKTRITSFSMLFALAAQFNQPIGVWNVSKITDFTHAFTRCTDFNQPLDDWDVSAATNMDSMFFGTSSFTYSLTNWCVPSFTSEPEDFSVSSALTQEQLPVWGTCPTPVEPGEVVGKVLGDFIIPANSSLKLVFAIATNPTSIGVTGPEDTFISLYVDDELFYDKVMLKTALMSTNEKFAFDTILTEDYPQLDSEKWVVYIIQYRNRTETSAKIRFVGENFDLYRVVVLS